MHLYVIVHKGTIVSLADSAVAMPLIRWVGPGGRITTIVLKINFFVSVNKGELKEHAEIIHRGSKNAVDNVEVINEEGKLVAKVIGAYSIKRGD